MALRNIIEDGHPSLSKVCKPVRTVGDHEREILDDLTETMRHAEVIGLAAPQVGILRRMVVIEVDDQLYELVNPVITEAEGDQFEYEGCLSVPGMRGRVHRPEKVKVSALDRNGEQVEYTGEGLLARAFCHELDHLDGVLYNSKCEDYERITASDEEEEEQ